MAPEEDKRQEEVELSLEVVDAAIKAVKGDDLDINPFTLARHLGLAPELLFESRELMGRIIEARRKTQGDSATFSMDSELLLKVRGLEEELAKLAEVNQELYDRGMAIEEQLLAAEAKVTDLEQEAETLAMQLQNSWHLGYNKGLADGQQKAGKEEAVPAASQENTGDNPAVGHTTVEHEVVEAEVPASAPQRDTQRDPQRDPQRDTLPPPQNAPTAEAAPPEKEAEVKGAADSGNGSRQSEEENITDTGEFSSPEPSYNEKVFNAAHNSFVPTEGKDNYGNFSWREIETVYQYSAVAGRPNINLYFEPFVQAPVMPEADEEDAVVIADRKQLQTGSMPSIKQEKPVQAETPDRPNQNETQPIPGAAAFFQAQAKAEEAARQEEVSRQKKKKSEERHIRSYMDMDDINSGSLTMGGGLYESPEAASTSPFARPINAGGPMADSLDEEKKPPELSTYDALNAVKIEDTHRDELDLDKLDIFEGLEDIEELSQIEVIEDVVLPQEAADESEQAAKPAASQDLRELVKNRIKQAEYETQTAEKAPPETVQTGGNNPRIDAESLKAGVRNKFVGGKASAGAPEQQAAPVSAPRVVPPEIRKACMILGVRPEELTVKLVVDAWKREMSQPGVHPDTGGDTETAIYLNNAKVELVKWIEAQTPKLGKKFGGQTGAKPQESGKPFIMGQKPPDKGQDKK
ncbi:MAG: hypothetical protein HY986_09240 [Candidatus Melainabacteria bacterium]|nr:hypothetical protein [Candidatus Melainabacteria bacterium]